MKKVALVCHCLEVLALTVWVGGLVVIIASVIPAVFNTIGMEAGGRLLTRTFHGYDRLVLGAAAVAATGMLVRTRGAGEAVGRGDWVLLGAMIVVAVTLTFYLSPETVRLQELAFMTKEGAAKKAAYDDFFAYHRVARALYLVNLGLGIAMLCLKVRKWAR
jgi:uncharacterized membrane protein